MVTIYFLHDISNKAVKIGSAKDVKRRIDKLQCGNVNKLELVHQIYDVYREVEFDIHAAFKDFRINREWFKDSILNHLRKAAVVAYKANTREKIKRGDVKETDINNDKLYRANMRFAIKHFSTLTESNQENILQEQMSKCWSL